MDATFFRILLFATKCNDREKKIELAIERNADLDTRKLSYT